MDDYVSADLTTTQARWMARHYGIKTPRVGYEVSCGNGLWLASTGHFQFGWFAKPRELRPFRIHGYKKSL